ncbi:MAG: hypothetical protein KDK39_00550 [Leptospiraceae bacterium]|nr:hypothetical protein [Leptospiraceae bacterium]
MAVWIFGRTRWLQRFKLRSSLQRWQYRRLRQFLRQARIRFQFYRNQAGPKSAHHFSPIPNGDPAGLLQDWPPINKAVMQAEFSALNAIGLDRQSALGIARRAEAERDFRPQLQSLTIGLSSGTSGKPGLFLVSPVERLTWAAVILARGLDSISLRQLLLPWLQPLRIALFLRANSNLYEGLGSRRLQFAWFDLLAEPQQLRERLQQFQPHILVAPASVLVWLSKESDGLLALRALRQIFNAAEVLPAADRLAIEKRFGVRPQEIYQCTEGLLGISCQSGNLHLNEDFIYFEKEWLDERRFHPVLTDFSRSSQAFIRYRLDDILEIDPRPCPCQTSRLRIKQVVGRADEVLYFQRSAARDSSGGPGAPGDASAWQPLFPDSVRQLMYSSAAVIRDYQITQYADRLVLQLDLPTTAQSDQVVARIRKDWQQRLKQLQLMCPPIVIQAWQAREPGAKQIRIRSLIKAVDRI